MINLWRGELHTLVGFENNWENGKGSLLNFILSNGTRSTKKDEDWQLYTHMIPADALNKIRSVNIHYYRCI